MDQCRTPSGPDVRGRLGEGPVAGEEVGAVDGVHVQPRERAHEARDVTAWRLDVHGHGDRVAVVFHEEEHRQPFRARRVQRLPELTFARRAFAEGREDDLVSAKTGCTIRDVGQAAIEHAGLGRADRVQDLRRRRARSGHDVQRLVAPVRGHLSSAVARVERRADAGEQHLERGHAELKAERPIAVVRMEPVVAGLEGHPGSDLHGFVAGAADLEEDAALVAELDLLVVELPRSEHAAVHIEQGARSEAAIPARLSRRLGGPSCSSSSVVPARWLAVER